MNRLISLAVSLFLFLSATMLIPTQTIIAGATKVNVIQAGEELNYEVSYMGLKLGSIKVVTKGFETVNGVSCVKAIAYSDSYKSIPFVDLHNVSTGWMDPNLTHSYMAMTDTKSGGESTSQYIKYDYEKKTVSNEVFTDSKLTFKNESTFEDKCNDGMSLFFLARRYLTSKRTIEVPTVMGTTLGPTTLIFKNKKEISTIASVSYPIKTVHFEGIADWVGIYGLTGRFEGWFSDDDARVPIKAKMKVYMGYIDIELVSYKRKGWQPPEAQE